MREPTESGETIPHIVVVLHVRKSVLVERCAAKYWPWWLRNRSWSGERDSLKQRPLFFRLGIQPRRHILRGSHVAPYNRKEWQSRVTCHDSRGINRLSCVSEFYDPTGFRSTTIPHLGCPVMDADVGVTEQFLFKDLCDCSYPGRSAHHRDNVKVRQILKIVAGDGKKARNVAPHPSGPHPSGPHPCMNCPPRKMGGLGGERERTFWPESNWPKSSTARQLKFRQGRPDNSLQMMLLNL